MKNVKSPVVIGRAWFDGVRTIFLVACVPAVVIAIASVLDFDASRYTALEEVLAAMNLLEYLCKHTSYH